MAKRAAWAKAGAEAGPTTARCLAWAGLVAAVVLEDVAAVRAPVERLAVLVSVSRRTIPPSFLQEALRRALAERVEQAAQGRPAKAVPAEEQGRAPAAQGALVAPVAAEAVVLVAFRRASSGVAPRHPSTAQPSLARSAWPVSHSEPKGREAEARAQFRVARARRLRRWPFFNRPSNPRECCRRARTWCCWPGSGRRSLCAAAAPHRSHPLPLTAQTAETKRRPTAARSSRLSSAEGIPRRRMGTRGMGRRSAVMPRRRSRATGSAWTRRRTRRTAGAAGTRAGVPRRGWAWGCARAGRARWHARRRRGRRCTARRRGSAWTRRRRRTAGSAGRRVTGQRRDRVTPCVSRMGPARWRATAMRGMVDLRSCCAAGRA